MTSKEFLLNYVITGLCCFENCSNSVSNIYLMHISDYLFIYFRLFEPYTDECITEIIISDVKLPVGCNYHFITIYNDNNG